MFDPVVCVIYNIVMKNKVLLSMLIVFILLAGVWITCGTIFVVRDVEIVETAANTSTLTDAEITHLVEETNLKGKSILFNLNQNEITSHIKTVDATLKVQNITAVFPNKVVINLTRRVPVYTDVTNQCYYDADMCILRDVKNAVNCVDVTAANLQLTNSTAAGDEAQGLDARNQRKIDQLKTVANFPNLAVSGVAYDESINGDPYLRLELQIGQESTARFVLKTKADEDFAHLLAWTYGIYQKRQSSSDYTAMYNTQGKVTVSTNGGNYVEQ